MTDLPAQPAKAAQYLRMSTDHQKYSLANQAAAIAVYAQAHGYEVVRTYEDAGKSGVTTEGRDGLRALLSDIMGGKAGFSTVLVLDVSRWGRFQDPDQGAHYEFVCRDAGVKEHFDRRGNIGSRSIDKDRNLPSYVYILSRFGSLPAAYAAAGIPYPRPRARGVKRRPPVILPVPVSV